VFNVIIKIGGKTAYKHKRIILTEVFFSLLPSFLFSCFISEKKKDMSLYVILKITFCMMRTVDKFGNPIDPEVGYARGKILKNSQDEAKRREHAFEIIRWRYNKWGRASLYDLTGLAGGFLVEIKHLEALETYIGPAVFQPELEELAKKHLGDGEVIALNRATAGILATFLALLKSGEKVVHLTPRSPAHPSFVRAVRLAGAEYTEVNKVSELENILDEKTRILAITGATMDYVVIPLEELRKAIELAHEKNVIVFVDDASGARIRTAIYNHPRARDLGADLVVTSTDKLMFGPRGGLMVGRPELISKIRAKVYELGLEAQPPLIAGIVGALKAYNPERLRNAVKIGERMYEYAKKLVGENVERSPVGFRITAENVLTIIMERAKISKTKIVPVEASSALALKILEEYGIITVPAVGMPGASPTMRVDATSKDMERIKPEKVVEHINEGINEISEKIKSLEEIRKVIHGT